MPDTFNPFDWYWIVGGDETRYWSSAAGAYVDKLQEDAGLTRILSEQELTDVLAAYGLPGPVPTFTDLSRPAFLFMMEKLGITKDAVHALIDSMPADTPEEGDAKTLARIVFDEQQSFARENELLKVLTAKAGLSDEQIDAAWRAGEGLKW